MAVYQVNEWLKHATGLLDASDVASARLDALILLEDALKSDRAYLLAHPECTVQGSTLYQLEQRLQRRAKHEPLAYIRGKCEFFGREFVVTKDTLQPRSETEAMIALLKGAKLPKYPVIADIGTGTGALAITAKLEIPSADVYAVDIHQKALDIARKNAANLGADIHFYKGNLLSSLPTTINQLPLTVILANLPYVPDSYAINRAAQHEPKLAIFGGHDGLDCYREMFAQIQEFDTLPRYVLTESLTSQHKLLHDIATQAGYKLQVTDVLIQLFVN